MVKGEPGARWDRFMGRLGLRHLAWCISVVSDVIISTVSFSRRTRSRLRERPCSELVTSRLSGEPAILPQKRKCVSPTKVEWPVQNELIWYLKLSGFCGITEQDKIGILDGAPV